MMKKRFNLLWAPVILAALLLATACGNDETLPPGGKGNGGERIVFTLAPEQAVQTRAGTTPPTFPADKVLRYIMEVYDSSNNIVPGSRQVKTVASGGSTSVEFAVEKTTGATYTVVFWADFTAIANPKNDLYYDTETGGLSAVTFKTATPTDFDGEAFCGKTTINTNGVPATTAITLKHCVAQINLKTNAVLTGKQSVKVTYGEAGNANAPMSTFNILDESVTAPATIAGVIGKVDAAASTGATKLNPYTFHTFYVFAPKGAQRLVNMEVAMCSNADGTGTTVLQSIPNVPLQSNYRTNITGNFGKVMTVFSIDCDDTWEGDIDVPWDGTIPAPNKNYKFGGGSGTEADPYLISKAADLAQLTANVNTGTNLYENKYFKQIIDIDLDNNEWTPIGKENSPLLGNFDGQSHKIYGLKITTAQECVGLFGRMYNNTLTNVHVVDGTIDITPITAGYYVGGITGMTESSATIKNCSFSGSININIANSFAALFTGGICGGGTGVISACKNSGEIEINESTNAYLTYYHIGGISGNGEATVEGCYNKGDITYKSSYTQSCTMGGICGQAKGLVKGCYNIGNITASRWGGIISAIATQPQADNYVKVSGFYTTNTEKVFGAGSWPQSTDAGWAIDDTGTNGYWKDLGNWNNGTPVYPKLWWEE